MFPERSDTSQLMVVPTEKDPSSGSFQGHPYEMQSTGTCTIKHILFPGTKLATSEFISSALLLGSSSLRQSQNKLKKRG